MVRIDSTRVGGRQQRPPLLMARGGGSNRLNKSRRPPTAPALTHGERRWFESTRRLTRLEDPALVENQTFKDALTRAYTDPAPGCRLETFKDALTRAYTDPAPGCRLETFKDALTRHAQDSDTANC